MTFFHIPLNLNMNYFSGFNAFSPGFSSYQNPFMFQSSIFTNYSFPMFNLPAFDFNSTFNSANNFNLLPFNMSIPTFNYGGSFNNKKKVAKPNHNESYEDNGGKTKWDKYILKYAKEYNVDADLVRAIMKQESQFKPNVTSKCGAMGLMQLMPATAKSYGVTNAYDPEQNIKGGVKMLAELMKKFNGNIKIVAAAYNSGPNRECLKRGEIPNIPETQKYVKNVEKYYKEFKAMG